MKKTLLKGLIVICFLTFAFVAYTQDLVEEGTKRYAGNDKDFIEAYIET